ncbi:MAG: hypothetical protein JRH20_20385 [Deltaproteobacteria bacterium]|nr:hypothetical protein [Deltaproteobacteria bacterium]
MKRFPLLVALFGASLVFSACSDDDGPAPDASATSDAGVTVDGSLTVDASAAIEVTVDITYPANAIAAGQRPTLAVYDKASYPDLTQRPAAMPLAALLGNEGDQSLSGTILDLLQTKSFVFEAGKAYVIAAGISAATGLPIFLDNTQWVAKELTLEQADTLTITADDTGWAQ